MSHLVAESAERYLHESVREGKDAHDPSPSALVYAEVFFYLHAGKGDACAVKECYDAENDEQREYDVSFFHLVRVG